MIKIPKQPWPTKAAMEQIYEKHLWGGINVDFYSGEGSHNTKLVDPYIEVITNFLKSFESPISVCDLGCGDFNIGQQLVPFTNSYRGVDIVPALIERNKKKYTIDNLSFLCLDLAKDELPQGDCALVRQVLQHLSNDEVNKILQKLCKFQYVIITEHLPLGTFEPNIDIISGQGIRIKYKSGLDVLAPPFEWKVRECKELLVVELENGKGKLVTTLFKLF
jgi:hypothetical protein